MHLTYNGVRLSVRLLTRWEREPVYREDGSPAHETLRFRVEATFPGEGTKGGLGGTDLRDRLLEPRRPLWYGFNASEPRLGRDVLPSAVSVVRVGDRYVVHFEATATIGEE